VGVIVWLWLRLRAAQSARAAVAAGQPHALEPRHGMVVCEVGGYLYWLSAGSLVRARCVNGLAEVDSARPVDPLTVDDVDPATLVEILDALERVGG